MFKLSQKEISELVNAKDFQCSKASDTIDLKKLNSLLSTLNEHY